METSRRIRKTMHTLQIPILPKLYQDLHAQVNRQDQLSAIRKCPKCQPVVPEYSTTPLELDVDMAEMFADDAGPSPDEKQFPSSVPVVLNRLQGFDGNEQCSAAVGLILMTLIELQLPCFPL